MSECPFCRFAMGLAAWPREFSQHDGVMTFEPLNPFVPGHRLVVPNEHVEDITTAHSALVGQVMARAAAFARRHAAELGADGVNVLTSIGEAATQSVMHWHVHVIPRFDGDDLGRWPWKPPAPPAGPFRVGRSLGRTVYDGDTLIGIMDTPELGAMVVDALNAHRSEGDDRG